MLKAPWRSSWQAMNEALEFSKKNWRAIAWLVFGQVLVLVFSFLLTLISTGPENIYQRVYGGGLDAGLQIVVVVVGIVYALLYSIALMELVRNPKRNIGEIVTSAVTKKLLPAVVLFALLLGGLVLPSSLFSVFGTGIYIYVSSLLYVLIFVFYIYFALALYILVLEDTSILEAFKRSYRYIDGWWWLMLSRLIMIFGVLTVIGLFGLVPFYGVGVVYVLSLLAVPVFLVYMTQTYLELRKAKRKSSNSGLAMGYKLLILLWALVVLSLFSYVSRLGDFVKEVTFLEVEETEQLPVILI